MLGPIGSIPGMYSIMLTMFCDCRVEGAMITACAPCQDAAIIAKGRNAGGSMKPPG